MEASAPATREIFVYGTLLWPAVLEVLLRRLPEARPAVINGFARKRVCGQTYPALVKANVEIPCPSGRVAESPVVTGLLLTVKPSEIAMLDWYEGEEYEMLEVEALAPDPPPESSPFSWATNEQSVDGGSPAWATGSAAVKIATTTYAWKTSTPVETEEWTPGVFAPHETEFVRKLVDEVAGLGACP